MWRSTEEKMRQKAAGGGWLAMGPAVTDQSLSYRYYYYIYIYHTAMVYSTYISYIYTSPCLDCVALLLLFPLLSPLLLYPRKTGRKKGRREGRKAVDSLFPEGVFYPFRLARLLDLFLVHSSCLLLATV